VDTLSFVNLANPKVLPPAWVLPLRPGIGMLMLGICMLGIVMFGIVMFGILMFGRMLDTLEKDNGGYLEQKWIVE
jgi:hypothetical protein